MIFGSTVLIQVSRSVDLLYIFLTLGIVTVLIGLYLLYGIKDVIALKQKQILNRRSALTPISTPHLNTRSPSRTEEPLLMKQKKVRTCG